MTNQATKVMQLAASNGTFLTPEQAEIIAAKIIDEGLRVTFLTILEIVLILWVTS